MNDLNLNFYRRISIDKFQEFAQLIGLDQFTDLQVVYPKISHCQTIIELGAGYGRVIEFLQKQKFQGEIIAYERSPELFEYLKGRFAHNPALQLIQEDFKYCQIEGEIEAVLWMWSGFLEYSEQEQALMVSKIGKRLTNKGLLILEIPDDVKFIGQTVANQVIKVESEWGNIEAYMPTEAQIRQYAQQGGFGAVQRIDYQTSTNLKRIIYVLEKWQ